MRVRSAFRFGAYGLALIFVVSLQAEESLTLSEAEVLALKDEPGIEALEAQRDALGQSAVAVGQLPDPRLQIGVSNYPIETGDFHQEGMSHLRVGFKQDFPTASSRHAATEQHQAMGLEITHLIHDRRLMVQLTVRSLWLDVFYELRARDLIQASLGKLQDLHEMTRSLYAVGLSNQTDLLNLDLEISRLTDEIASTEERQMASRSMLSQWIQEAASRTLPSAEPSLPKGGFGSSSENAVTNHPLLLAAEAKIAASEADIEQARSQFRPNVSGEVSYALRDGELQNGESRSDFLSLSVGVRLPIFTEKRQNKQLQAALRRNSAAKFEKAVVLRDLDARYSSASVRLNSLNERLKRYEAAIVPQAINYAEAAVASYQSEVGEYKDVIESQRLALQVQLERIRLVVDRIRVWTEMEYLSGESNVE